MTFSHIEDGVLSQISDISDYFSLNKMEGNANDNQPIERVIQSTTNEAPTIATDTSQPSATDIVHPILKGHTRNKVTDHIVISNDNEHNDANRKTSHITIMITSSATDEAPLEVGPSSSEIKRKQSRGRSQARSQARSRAKSRAKSRATARQSRYTIHGRLIRGGSGDRIKYEPTYRMTSQKPMNFAHVDFIIKNSVRAALQHPRDLKYNSAQAMKLCDELTKEIHFRIKLMQYDRYKVIVLVNVFEKLMQGIHWKMGFIWDTESDQWTSYQQDANEFTVSVVVLGVYLE